MHAECHKNNHLASLCISFLRELIVNLLVFGSTICRLTMKTDIPLHLCHLFKINHGSTLYFYLCTSYLEICNERVQDLLKKRASPTDDGGLSVREHPRHGPYVESKTVFILYSMSILAVFA